MKVMFRLLVELVIVAAVLLSLRYGPRAVERAMGLPSADEWLLYAAGGDDAAALGEALDRGGSPRACDKMGATPLMNAALMGHVEFVRELLDRGADVNAASKYGESALIYAARSDRAVVVALLLSHGADIHHRNQLGQTALDVAEMFGSHDCAELLRRAMGNADQCG
jgi:uncharacterized protein